MAQVTGVAARKARKVRRIAASTVGQIAILLDRLEKVCPGCTEWDCEHGEIGEMIVGLGQARVYARMLLAMSDEGLQEMVSQ